MNGACQRAVKPLGAEPAAETKTAPKGAVSTGDGGARRDRTDDLLHAMQALSQLSYGPISLGDFGGRAHRSAGVIYWSVL